MGIDAHLPTFHFYKSGVYHDHKCSSVHLDHGVLVVGYGTEEGKVRESDEKGDCMLLSCRITGW